MAPGARSARFPRYDLDASIAVARVIHERGAGGVVSSDELAEFLEYSSTVNGAYLYRVAAARLFNLIIGEGRAIQISPLALDIIRPDHPESAARARLDAFYQVPLYRAFADANEGKELPPAEHLRNVLAKLGVPEKETAVALSRMLDSADQAGLFRIAGKRTKMIRPTFADRVPESPAEQEPTERSSPPETAGLSRFPKIIEGVLDNLPNERQWDEDEFAEWLDFFERALRVHYRLPRTKRSPP
jgi:hypothetical protein